MTGTLWCGDDISASAFMVVLFELGRLVKVEIVVVKNVVVVVVVFITVNLDPCSVSDG